MPVSRLLAVNWRSPGRTVYIIVVQAADDNSSSSEFGSRSISSADYRSVKSPRVSHHSFHRLHAFDGGI